MAMPVADPRAAAPPAPSTALAPAATRGAASPPVTPGRNNQGAVSTDKKLLDEDYKCKTSKMELKAAGEQMQNITVINHTLW